MLYLIDANSVIDAKDLYYVIDRVPEYWEWLIHHGEANRLKVPAENFEEISPGTDKKDAFYIWRKDAACPLRVIATGESGGSRPGLPMHRDQRIRSIATT